MKSLEEYRTEIFRRSELRIGARRRRQKQLLAVCIPLCLLLVCIPAVISPAFAPSAAEGCPENAHPPGNMPEGMGQEADTGYASCPYTEAQIDLDDLYSCAGSDPVWITDAAITESLYTLSETFCGRTEAIQPDAAVPEELPSREGIHITFLSEGEALLDVILTPNGIWNPACSDFYPGDTASVTEAMMALITEYTDGQESPS